ncbi:hypothetical protein RvY_04557-2 [Ramazzottius varieornatus]|uniref:Peptidase S1 domain-containing protein n=1 Tax=Ramazzottius varieornatus TaxID=947166 RepID=A0A1D1UXQ9_RAMVA|nr:hypothetical protein RvY_04557-2 [Ramazzottius varieornatus]
MRKFRCFMLAVVFLVECFINYAHTAGPQQRFSSRINQRQRPEVSDPTTPSSLSDLVTISTSRPQFPRVQQNPVLSTTTTTKITTVKPATTRITTVSTTAPIVTTEALPAEGEAPAGIFHLNSTFFAPSTDLILDPQLLPGLSSGFVTVPSKFRPDNQPSDRTRLKDSGPPAGRKCTVKLDGATGTCAQFNDVILGHTCVSMSTALSDHCSDGQVCCFMPTVNKAAAMEYDQVPCGQRKLNESSIALVLDAQIARARVFDTLSGRIIGGVPAEENEICWQAAIMVDKEYACGGAIIDSRHVITAAHWSV